MIPIGEIFYSSQGEGLRTGVPSIFVRVGLCNFTCSGFGCEYTTPSGQTKTGCDSYHSVDASFKSEWMMFENYIDMVEIIDSVSPTLSVHNMLKPDIVITGGEPLIYWKDDNFQRLIAHYITRGHKVTIETNASLSIEFTRKYQSEIIFSMSVKLSNSGEPEHKRINIDNITNILEQTSNSYLKFVCSKDNWDNEFGEIRGILKNIPVYVERVYLMPMGENKQNLENNALFVMEKTVDLGFMYSDRIHIRCWNDERQK